MHSARARIRPLAGALLVAGLAIIHPIMTLRAFDRVGDEYVNICATIAPPFVARDRRGADVTLVNVLISRLAHVRVIVAAPIDHCDILLPDVRDDASTRPLIGSDFYDVEKMMICGAKRRDADDWRKLRTIAAAQLAMAVPFVLYVAVTYCIAAKLMRADRFQDLGVMVWSYFRILCSVPNGARRLPTQRALRFLYTGWLIFCFILTVNYNALVLRVFERELYAPQIRSYAQAVRENVDLHTPTGWRASAAHPRVFDCRSVRRCLRLLKAAAHAHRRDARALLVVLPEAVVDYHRGDFVASGELTIHCFEHPHAVYKRRMFVRSDGAIGEHWNVAALNALLGRLRRSGLYAHWLRRFARPDLRMQRSFHQNGDDVRACSNGTLVGDAGAPRHAIGVLTYKDFVVLYAYLLIGALISTIGFVGEHVYYYLKRNGRCSLAR